MKKNNNIQKEIDKMQEQMNINALKENLNRARSLSVGNCGGGVVEISMRFADGHTGYILLQPVEAIEFIHQLSAAVGCHIHIQPRKDFACWRNWQYSDEELEHYRGNSQPLGAGHPPQIKQHVENNTIGVSSFPENGLGVQQDLFTESENNE